MALHVRRRIEKAEMVGLLQIVLIKLDRQRLACNHAYVKSSKSKVALQLALSRSSSIILLLNVSSFFIRINALNTRYINLFIVH